MAAAAGSLVAFSATATAFFSDASAAGGAREDRRVASSAGFAVRSRLLAHEHEPLASSAKLRLAESSPWNASRTRARSKLSASDDVDDVAATAGEAMGTALETLRNRFRVGDSYVWLYRDAEGNPTSWERYTVTGIFEESNHHNSDERESDKERRPEFVATIEMSTKFEEGEAYQTHHRIKANLIDHYMESSESREGWRIGFEFFTSDGEGGAWKTFGKGDNVQAFEEKFDVFSMISTTAARSSNKSSDGESQVPWTSPAKTYCDTETGMSTRPASLGVTKNAMGGGDAKVLAKQTAELNQTKRHGYTEAWYGPSDHDTLSGIALYKEFPRSQHSFSLIERTTRLEQGGDAVTDAIEVIVRTSK